MRTNTPADASTNKGHRRELRRARTQRPAQTTTADEHRDEGDGGGRQHRGAERRWTRRGGAKTAGGPSELVPPMTSDLDSPPRRKRLKTMDLIAKRNRQGALTYSKRRGALSYIVCMPFDIIHAIASELEPRDLIYLAQSAKIFSKVLLARSSSASGLWNRALARVDGLPPCPTGLTPPQYASLVFIPVCRFCLSKVYRIMWSLHVRCCMNLVKYSRLEHEYEIRGIPRDFFKGNLKDLGRHIVRQWTPTTRSSAFCLRSELDSLALDLRGAARFIDRNDKFTAAAKAWDREVSWQKYTFRFQARMERRRAIVERLTEFETDWRDEFVDTERTLKGIGQYGHTGAVEFLAVSNDERALATGGREAVNIWRRKGPQGRWGHCGTLGRPKTAINRRNDPVVVTSLHWYHGDLIVSYLNNPITCWSTDNFSAKWAINTDGQVGHGCLSPDPENAPYFAVSTYEKSFDIYHLTTHIPEDSFVGIGPELDPFPVLMVHGGRAVLCASGTGELQLWPLRSNALLQTLHHPGGTAIAAIAANYDHTDDVFHIAASCVVDDQSAGTISVWRAQESASDERENVPLLRRHRPQIGADDNFVNSVLILSPNPGQFILAVLVKDREEPMVFHEIDNMMKIVQDQKSIVWEWKTSSDANSTTWQLLFSDAETYGDFASFVADCRENAISHELTQGCADLRELVIQSTILVGSEEWVLLVK
ncbi:hypothetical protein PLICRDRAFT_173286 [Plicaturopsis crispa FD-325 SS-3]|nr:hypothetical protein PLICRDRAFT_173286 [Plicaturopsis crispa FD-325 SS-3]